MSESPDDLYKNRREHARVDVDLRALLVHDELHAEDIELLMSNLSLGGCFIKTAMPEPSGSMVMLRFSLPGDAHAPVVRAVGKVCWTKGGRESGMGIQFVRIEDEDLGVLKRYIAGLLSDD